MLHALPISSPLFDYRNRAKHEIFRAVNMHITVFWKVTPCSLVYVYQLSGQNCIRPLPETQLFRQKVTPKRRCVLQCACCRSLLQTGT